jgi:tetratricopeptide (TPR) repeat protein
MKLIRQVVVRFPKHEFFNTLATAEYRMGNFEKAVAAALRSLELSTDNVYAGDFAILAMSHFELGKLEKANEYRAKFLEAMDEFKDDEDCNRFAVEVKGVFDNSSKTEIEAKSSQPKKEPVKLNK